MQSVAGTSELVPRERHTTAEENRGNITKGDTIRKATEGSIFALEGTMSLDQPPLIDIYTYHHDGRVCAGGGGGAFTQYASSMIDEYGRECPLSNTSPAKSLVSVSGYDCMG